MACVYRHRRKTDGNVFYIGIGREDYRATSHQSRNKFWWSIVNKHGFDAEIILSGISWEEACKWENYLIGLYGRRFNNTGVLCNINNGGESVPVLHGEMNGFYGRKHSEESLMVMREKAKARHSTEAHRKRMSQVHKGKIISDETKKILSDKYTLDSNPRAKKVVDIITGEVFGCGKSAALSRELNYNTLRCMLNGGIPNKTSLRYINTQES